MAFDRPSYPTVTVGAPALSPAAAELAHTFPPSPPSLAHPEVTPGRLRRGTAALPAAGVAPGPRYRIAAPSERTPEALRVREGRSTTHFPHPGLPHKHGEEP